MRLIQPLKELMNIFAGSFINAENELILDRETNLYFSLKKVDRRTDLEEKVISACSRDACKTEPYHTTWRNERYQREVRNGINKFLGVSFTKEEWLLIYTYIGGGCNDELLKRFVCSRFNLDLIKEHEKRLYGVAQ